MIRTTIVSALLAIAATAHAAEPFPQKGVIDKKNAATFYLDSNRDTETKTYNIVAKKWTKDGLEPATDLVVYPTQVVVEPNRRYAVKALFKGKKSDTQQTYRLFFTYVQPAQVAEGNVNLEIGFSVPLFVEPTAPKTYELKTSSEGGKTTITNVGNATYKTTSILKDGKAVDNKLLYILPGQSLTLDGANLEIGPRLD